MRKVLLLSITILLLIPKQTYSQNKGDATAAIAGGLLAIGAGIAAIKQMEEQAELKATQWILTNHNELSSFSLRTLDFKGKKLKDMSSTSVITFKVQEFNPSENIKLDGKKQILFGFTSRGWISETGINFEKVRWFLIDKTEWMNMMVSYVKVSSSEKNETTLKENLSNGKVVNKGVKVGRKITIPFFKLHGDMYLVTDYSSKMKLVYNEKSLGIFLKETNDLIQMRRNTLIKVHEFLFESEE